MKRAMVAALSAATLAAGIPLAVATAQDEPPPPPPASPAAEQATEVNGAAVEPVDCADFLAPEDVEPGGDCVVIDVPPDSADPTPLEAGHGGITVEGAEAICAAMGPDFEAEGNPLCSPPDVQLPTGAG